MGALHGLDRRVLQLKPPHFTIQDFFTFIRYANRIF
jgi:hypothetical protein